MSRDPARCRPGLGESKFSSDSDEAASTREGLGVTSGQWRPATQPHLWHTSPCPCLKTFAFYIACLFVCLCFCIFLPFACLSLEKGKVRLSVCTPLLLTLPPAAEWKMRRKLSKSTFKFFRLVCLFTFCLSCWELADLDLALAPAAEGDSWKDQRWLISFSYICLLLSLFVFPFIYLFGRSLFVSLGISCSWPCGGTGKARRKLERATLRKVNQLRGRCSSFFFLVFLSFCPAFKMRWKPTFSEHLSKSVSE